MFHESLNAPRAPGPRHRRIRPDIPACPGDLRVRDRAGARHAFRVTCPGLFPVALSGLQEHARVAQGRFLPRLVSPGWRGWPRSGRGWMATSRPWAREHVGAAPCGCPSGSNGDALSRRGRRLEHVLVLRGQSRMVSRGIGTLAGHPNGDALSRRGRRLEHVPFSVANLVWFRVGSAPSPVIRTGTRCRAADGAWNMSPFSVANLVWIRVGSAPSRCVGAGCSRYPESRRDERQ